MSTLFGNGIFRNGLEEISSAKYRDWLGYICGLIEEVFYSLLMSNNHMKELAGAGGFEPPNAGIKSRCLRPLGYAPK